MSPSEEEVQPVRAMMVCRACESMALMICWEPDTNMWSFACLACDADGCAIYAPGLETVMEQAFDPIQMEQLRERTAAKSIEEPDEMKLILPSRFEEN